MATSKQTVGGALPGKKTKSTKKQPPLPFDGEAPAVTPKLFVSSVRGNVKGSPLLPAGVTLGPRTLILGDNFTGKSSIAMAVELALTGRVSNLMGRDVVAADRDLVAWLCPDSEKELWAEVELSDGRKARWSCVRGKKSVHSGAPGVDVSRVLPVRAVKEAIKASGDGTRQYFFRYACADLGLKDIWRSISEDLAAEAITAGLPDPDVEGLSGFEVSEKLLAALEKARELKTKADAELKGANDLLSEQAGGLAPEPTDADVAQLESALEEARSGVVNARIVASEGDARQKLADAEAELQKLVEEKTVAQDEYAGMMDLRANQRTLASCVKEGLKHCPTCGTAPIDPAVFVERGEMLAAHVPELAEIEESQRVQRAQADRISVLQATVTELTTRLREAPDGVLSVADAEAAESDASNALVEARSLREQWKRVRSAKDSIDAKKKKAARQKELVEALQTSVNDLLDGALLKFKSRVSSMLPAGWAFDAQGEGDKFRIAVRHAEGRGGPGLSDAELSAGLAAVGGAVAGPFGVVIPEDKAFSPRVLGDALVAYERIPVQVLVQSPVDPAVAASDAWTIVRTSSSAA